jgi:nicotinamidase-related amidase
MIPKYCFTPILSIDSPSCMNYITPDNLDLKTDQWLDRISPYNLHDWVLDPSKSALMVIDFQNFFVTGPDGGTVAILPNIQMLIESFRKADRPVIFTQHMHKADGSDMGVIGQWWPQNVIENTRESEISSTLDIKPCDIVIRKCVYSSFVGTDLENILHDLGVTDLVISGVLTNCCCETAARDAFCRNFRVFFPADASATTSEELHLASLMNIGYGFGVVTKTRTIIDWMM